jgi:hypothetical protein
MDKKIERPAVSTLIYWLIQDKKITLEDIFSFKELYWPSFIQKDGCIFLKEQFTEEEYDRLLTENDNPEYWINLYPIDDLFSEISDGEEKSIILVKALAEIWGAKLKNDYPDMNFTIECLLNQEYGDCGLTFYQSDKNKGQGEIGFFTEIPSPTIKENRMKQSAKGPRPGISRIRKPKPDEFPG